MHILGQKLKKSTDVNWLADFRDPWTNIWYHKKFYFTKLTLEKHKFLENGILNDADHIIVTSESLNFEFSKLTKKPISTITNGFDYINNNKANLDKEFSMSHIGSMLSDRNPEILWKVLKRLITEVKGFSDSFKLNLIGNLSDEVKDSIKHYSLDSYVRYVGHIPYNETSNYLQNSQTLLLIQTNKIESNSIIPAKLFEYLNSNRPIISISNNLDVVKIIADTKVGYNFNYNQELDLYNSILDYFTKFSKGGIEISPKNINNYSRFELTKSISNIITNL
ncbi:hypothetical protein N8376_01000 [Flavobacteriaceae bacterium]|nr:hypothetical protein [Flavobacteriaceae bacterium]